MRFIWVVTSVGFFTSYVPTVISAESNVPRVPSPIHQYPTLMVLPGGGGFVGQPDPRDNKKFNMAPTKIGACIGNVVANNPRPGGPNVPATVSCDNLIPLEKLIQDPLDTYANWLAQDRAAQTRVVTDNIEVHSKLLDSLRARIQQLEQRIQALEKQ